MKRTASLILCLLGVNLAWADHDAKTSVLQIPRGGGGISNAPPGSRSQQDQPESGTDNHEKAAVLEFCASIGSAKYRSTCLRVADRADFYARGVADFCKTFQYNWYRIYCVDRLRNSRFQPNALSRCLEAADPRRINPPPESAKFECALDAARPTQKLHKSKSFRVQSRVEWPYGRQDAMTNILTQVEEACSDNWTDYSFQNEQWKSTDCGASGYYFVCSTVAFCQKWVDGNYETIRFSGWVE